MEDEDGIWGKKEKNKDEAKLCFINVARPGCLFSLSARPVRAGMKRYMTFPLINSDAYFYVFSVARFYV